MLFYLDAVPKNGYTSYLVSAVTRVGGADGQGLEIEVLADAGQAGGAVEEAIGNWDCTYDKNANQIKP